MPVTHLFSTTCLNLGCCSNIVVCHPSRLRPDDPEPIKLLKRAMSVAVSEEDYPEAIRLRDHQWMQMYRDIQVARCAAAAVGCIMYSCWQ